MEGAINQILCIEDSERIAYLDYQFSKNLDETVCFHLRWYWLPLTVSSSEALPLIMKLEAAIAVQKENRAFLRMPAIVHRILIKYYLLND